MLILVDWRQTLAPGYPLFLAAQGPRGPEKASSPAGPGRAGAEGQVGPASLPSRVPRGQLPPQASLALKLLCLLSHLHLCHRRISRNQNIKVGKKTAVLGKAAALSGPRYPLGDVSGPDSGSGCHHGYGPHKAPLKPSLPHDAFRVPRGMTPSFWARLPHLEHEELERWSWWFGMIWTPELPAVHRAPLSTVGTGGPSSRGAKLCPGTRGSHSPTRPLPFCQAQLHSPV